MVELSAQNERLTAQVDALTARVAKQEERIAQLERKTKRSSRNSSQPPSADPPGAPPRRGKDLSGRKQGAQLGHGGRGRPLLAAWAVDEFVEHWPTACACGHVFCEGELVADGDRARHQVEELPPITVTSNSFTPASPGTHRVIATYSGDANYNSSTSSCTDPTEAVTVNQAQPPNVPPTIGSAPSGAGGAGGNVFGGGGNGGDAGPCGGGGGAGGVGATGGGAGGGGCFDVPPVQRLRSGRIVAFVGVATNHSSAQARAFLELRGAGIAKATRLQLIGQTTIGRYKLSMRFSTKTRRALRGGHKATVRLRLRLSAPTGKPLTFSRTVTLAR